MSYRKNSPPVLSEKGQEKLKERIQLFLSHPFFVERPHLVVSLLEKENETGNKIPHTFSVTFRSPVGYEGRAEIGKIHHWYALGLYMEQGDQSWHYRVFKSKVEMKYYLVDIFSSNPALSTEDRAFWLSAIEEIPEK